MTIAAVLVLFMTPLRGEAQAANATASAQSTAELIAEGDRESRAHHSTAALALYERASGRDSSSYEAEWKASREAVDLGENESDASKRNAYFDRGTKHARRAVALRENEPDGHFALARALGRMALAAGPRDRVHFGGEVRAHALRTLELAPRHAGALHVMGVWNAEVMRLNSITRAFARTFLGGQVLASANWADAASYLERAVAVEPGRAVHHLDLARVYRDTKRPADARREYEQVLRAPDMDANDAKYKREASEELRKLGT